LGGEIASLLGNNRVIFQLLILELCLLSRQQPDRQLISPANPLSHTGGAAFFSPVGWRAQVKSGTLSK